MKKDKALWQASTVFAPSFPRQSSSQHTIQASRSSRSNFCSALSSAMSNEMPGYYSVYSFPRGHSRDGYIPSVDCIFIDLDVEGGDYDPKNGDTDFDAWRRDISSLLTRARMIAETILDHDEEQHFRVVLSGHKGLHIYLDFPTVSAQNGTFQQFKNGLKEYGDTVMSWLDSAAGGISISRWVDVDASDLGRLARHPNTIHHSAAYDDTTRWAVPVTMKELADLYVEDYLEYTDGPRLPDGYSRTPSDSAGQKVVQSIRTAPMEKSKTSRTAGSTFDPVAINDYDDEAKDEMEVEDIEFLTANYPCIKAWANRDDAFGHGNASHIMEVNVIGKLVEMGTPREVIHEFLEDIPGYRKSYTDDQINKIIGRGYSSFNCVTIADKAGQFCFGDDCSVYQRNDDIQK